MKIHHLTFISVLVLTCPFGQSTHYMEGKDTNKEIEKALFFLG